MPTLIHGYPASNASNNGALFSGVPALGQCFTSVAAYLDSADFYIKRQGTTTGNVYAKLYAITGSFGSTAVPTGAVLATSDPIDITTLTTIVSLVTFTFSGGQKYHLANATNYFIVCEFAGGDAANGITIYFDDTTPTDPGNLAVNVVGSGWIAVAGDDTIFDVYGLLDVTANLTGVAASPAVGTSSIEVSDLLDGVEANPEIGTGTVQISGRIISHATESFMPRRRERKPKVEPVIIPPPDVVLNLIGISANAASGLLSFDVETDFIYVPRPTYLSGEPRFDVSFRMEQTASPILASAEGTFRIVKGLLPEEIMALLDIT